jgi:ABC-2 type transport system ATP-binding protein
MSLKAKNQEIFSVKELLLKTQDGFCLKVDNLVVTKGDLLGVIGANGCGKTTFVESILGLRDTKSGMVRMFDTTFRANDNREVKLKNLGVQLQTVTYPDNYKVYEIIELHHLAYGQQEKILYQVFELDKLAKKNYVKLSRGQKQRVDLFIALAHTPELLILDEPSTGLDQVFRGVFNKLLEKRIDDPNLTTIMVTHTGEEVVSCNKILWLKDGQVFKYLESPTPEKKGVIRQKLNVNYTNENKKILTEILTNKTDVSYCIEKDFNAFTLFGYELGNVKKYLESQVGLTLSDVVNTDGVEFLRYVSEK